MLQDKTRSISCGQTASVIILYRVFTLMTYVPLIEQGYSLGTQLAAAVIAAAIQAALLIPSFLLFRNGGRITERTAVAVFWIYFCVASAGSAVRFCRFIGCRLGDELPSELTALMLAAVCIYCACRGIEGIARGSAVMLVFFVILALSVISGSWREISFTGVRADINYENVSAAVSEEIARSSELTMLCFLGMFTVNNYRRAALSAVSWKLAATVAVTSSVMLALGDYAYISRYPFLDLGSAAGVRFLQRIDAVYIMVWTAAAVMSLSAQFFLAGNCISQLTGCRSSEGIIFSALPVSASALIILMSGADTEKFFRFASSLPVQTVTVSLIPLAEYLRRRRETNRKERTACAR